MKEQVYCDQNDRLIFADGNEYALISLLDNEHINKWLQVLFEGYYPDLATTICFESLEMYLTTLKQHEDSLLVKTKYGTGEVVFLLVEFPEIDGMMEMELIQMLLYLLDMIKADFQLPVIPCVIFETERDYEVVVSLLNVLPYETALLINYMSFVYEE